VKAVKPKVRQVLLDATFINALLATDVPDHERAREVYGALVERYEAGFDRLFALSTVLDIVPRQFRRGALAPVLTLHVAGQHIAAARQIVEAPSALTALSLVMMDREHISAIATASHDFDPFEIEVLSIAEDSGVDSGLSSRTAPTPAPQPTGE
jgi:hypothetical protein